MDELDGFPEERSFENPSKAPSRAVAKVSLETSGKMPLVGNYNGTIVVKDIDSLVVELPVLVARDSSDYVGGEYWIAAEVTVDGKRVTESRQLVTRASVADLGPTVIWMKSNVPVNSDRGSVEIKVSKISSTGNIQSLFTKNVDYSL